MAFRVWPAGWHDDRVRFEKRDGYTLLIGWALPGASATTFRRLILVRDGREDDDHLIRHELEHVRQWREHGVVGFLVRYVRPYLLWRLRGYPHWGAYRRIPFEIEAEWLARRAELKEHVMLASTVRSAAAESSTLGCQT